ncbi:MAG: hypothetical protein JNL35_10030 [Sphingopyxis sp.]|nr:hypothetical protein [Sphingopyxis sp.]
MTRWMLVPLLTALTLGGCATPETRLRTGLIDAGLSQRVAGCMAERMVDRLSLLQLRRIGSLASLKDKRASDLSLNQFLYKVRALKDPEILSVTTSSAALCAFG